MNAEPGDLVIYLSSEWTVHSVDGDVALLRQHNDPDLKGTTVKAHLRRLSSPSLWAKAKDRN